MDTKALLSGYNFDDGPNLILDTIFESSPRRINFPPIDKAITLKVLDETMCIGSYNPKSNAFEMCPNKSKPEEGKTTCSYCSRLSGFNPAFYNAEYISRQQSVYNDRPHMVYLVNFGKNCTKVGIAHRLPRRWLEQGARAGTIIKHCKDAYEAREIEATTREIIKVPEAVNSSTKRKFLAQEFSFSSAESEILEVRDQIQNRLNFQLEINEIESLDKYYLKDNKIRLPLIDLTKESSFVSGRAIGLVGDILITEQNNIQYILSLKSAISHIVTIDDNIIPNQDKVQVTLGF